MRRHWHFSGAIHGRHQRSAERRAEAMAAADLRTADRATDRAASRATGTPSAATLGGIFIEGTASALRPEADRVRRSEANRVCRSQADLACGHAAPAGCVHCRADEGVQHKGECRERELLAIQIRACLEIAKDLETNYRFDSIKLSDNKRLPLSFRRLRDCVELASAFYERLAYYKTREGIKFLKAPRRRRSRCSWTERRGTFRSASTISTNGSTLEAACPAEIIDPTIWDAKLTRKPSRCRRAHLEPLITGIDTHRNGRLPAGSIHREVQACAIACDALRSGVPDAGVGPCCR